MPEVKIERLLNNIEFNDLVLPEFQREYIWRRPQAKSLFESLFKGYPTGSVLFWRTIDPPKLKNKNQVKNGKLMEIILDGQQRLVTLYLLTKDKSSPFYREKEIEHDPRNLYINLQTGEFMYYLPSKMKQNPLWVRVANCFLNKPSPIRIAHDVVSDREEAIELATSIEENLNRLLGILDKLYPVQYPPDNVSTSKAIDIFIKVNEEGTMPSDAELALAKISNVWGVARRRMKEKQRDLGDKGFAFDLDFFVRCLTGIVKRSARLEMIHKAKRDELVKKWEQLKEILDYLLNVLKGSFHIDSMEDIKTSLLLVPLVVYLAKIGGEFREEKMKKKFTGWLYTALAWRRYTGSTVSKLDKDISLVVTEADPIQPLVDQILEERGRIELSAEDLKGKTVRHPLYRLMLIMAKKAGAVDWFNGSHISPNIGKSYQIEFHHIFPKSLLYAQAYDGENTNDKRKVNEIANRAFLTKKSNLKISNNDPFRYLMGVQQRYPNALRNQCVPEDVSLWKITKFEEFKQKRRELIANEFNKTLHQLLSGVSF